VIKIERAGLAHAALARYTEPALPTRRSFPPDQQSLTPCKSGLGTLSFPNKKKQEKKNYVCYVAKRGLDRVLIDV
jgi:hypothetical protein